MAVIEEEALALVKGEVLTQLPVDLYIPPDAMLVVLEMFEGPLDLLLYLIKRHNLDILNIPVADITQQYIEYIDLMETMKIELAAEYLEMAAMLIEIKSKMLLPRNDLSVEEEEDPRAKLMRKLQEYKQIKQAALDLDALPRCGRDFYLPAAMSVNIEKKVSEPEVQLNDILFAFKDVLKRANLETSHNIQKETLSVRERMSVIMQSLEEDKFAEFCTLFAKEEGRLGVVVTLLAILEMVKECVLELVQSEPFAPIYVRRAA